MQVQLENNQYMYSFDSFDMQTIKYIFILYSILRPFRHEIKHKKIELNFIFLFKSHPLITHPSYVQQFTVHRTFTEKNDFTPPV